MTSPSLTTANRLDREIARLTPLAKSAADWRHLTELSEAKGKALQQAIRELGHRPLKHGQEFV